MRIPKQCHLWQQDPLTSDDLSQPGIFEPLKTYEDDSHLIRDLRRCTQCGQLYFYEFYEVIDWVNGNDPQYSTYLPVESIEEADELARQSVFDILDHYPRLQSDWPAEAELPKVYWIGRDSEAEEEERS